jgi:hypothetical protein
MFRVKDFLKTASGTVSRHGRDAGMHVEKFKAKEFEYCQTQ